MENHASGGGPICVLKVSDLQCCKACPEKVKKKIMQIKGVTSVNIDTKRGLVTVSGVADTTSMLMTAIEKAGHRKAELLMYEKEPKHQHDPNSKETHPVKAKQKTRKHTQQDHHHSGSDDSQRNHHQQETHKNMKHQQFPAYQFNDGPKHQHDPNLRETHPNKAKHKNRKHTRHDHHHSSSDESRQNDHQRETHKDMKHQHSPAHQLNNGPEAVQVNGAVPGYHDPPCMGMHGHGGSFPGSAPPYPWARRPYGYEGIDPCPMVFERQPPPVNGYYQFPPRLPPRLPTQHGEVIYSGGPVGSSAVHTFSDLNTNGCPIL